MIPHDAEIVGDNKTIMEILDSVLLCFTILRQVEDRSREGIRVADILAYDGTFIHIRVCFVACCGMENEVERVVDDVPGEKLNVVNGGLEEVVKERAVAALDESKEAVSDELKVEERVVVEAGGLKDDVEVNDEGKGDSVDVGELKEAVLEENDEGKGVVVESGESKDVEEEVFEEAVDSAEKLRSPVMKSELEADLDVVEDGREISGAGSDMEAFVEAAGVLAQDVNLESPASVTVDDKVESSLSGVNIDKTSDEVTDKEFGNDGVPDQTMSSEDLASTTVDDKVESSLDEGENIDKTSDEMADKNSGKDGVHEEFASSEDLVPVVEDKVEVLLGSESIDKIDEGGTNKEMGSSEPVGETIVFSGTSVNGGHEESNGDALVATSEDTLILPTESEKREIENDSSTETLVRADSEKVTILDVVSRDEECGELKHNNAVVDSTNGVSSSEHLGDKLVAMDGKQDDVENGELKFTASVENHEENCEVKDIAVILDTPVLEEAAIPGSVVLESPVQEKEAVPRSVVLDSNVVEEAAMPASIVLDEPQLEEADIPASVVLEAPVLEEAEAPANLSSSSSEKEVIQPSASTPSAANTKEVVEEKSNGGDIKTVIAEESGEKVEAKQEVENKTEDKREVENKTEDKREVETTHSNGVRGVNLAPRVASTSQKSTEQSSVPPPAHPAGLGRGAPLLEPAQRPVQQQQQQHRVNGTMSNVQSQQIDESSNGEGEEFDETREKLQMIRVKFLRLAHRLGQTPHNVVVAQVLYRLGLAEQLRGRNGGRVGAFSFDRASAMAEQLEAVGQEPLDFSCTIMVIGKSGVGKSATINSIFDEVKFNTDAFQSGTKRVQDVVGTVQGIKVRVIDTPGLLPSWSEQRHNEKILNSVKRFISKTPPDIVLYLDRLDMQTRDSGDMPLLRTITDIFGPSIWFNAIVVLTHAASAPPEGPNGTVSSYDMFVTQRSHIVQQAIRQAAGDMRLMNPVSLVENHSACRTNRAGQRVLPNGQVWKPHLLLLSFASKILAEANTLLKLQDSPPGKPHAPRSRAPPLPFLLSSLLQSRPQVKLPEEQFGDEDGGDDDLDDSSDSEDESSEYDELPPFKSLTRNQISKLTKDQRNAYHEELEYREKLFMKKQLKEEKRRRKFMKKMAAAAKDMPAVYRDNVEEEESGGGAASVPVPMPDLALPASFDSDNPTHRYRSLDNSNQWFVRPVLDSHGWDHDIGYDGINVERLLVYKDKIPVSFSGQVTKDKKDANVQMELATSLKHGDGGKATSMGFDMQTVGKDLAYTLRGETMLANFKKNKAAAGVSVTLLGDSLSAGAKFEDKLILNKRFRMVVSGGAMAGRGDVAYGGSLEAQLRDKDYPLGRSLSTLGLSVMDWHGDLAIGCNIQSQIPIGRSTNLIARANLNNRGAGQISMRVNSSEQLQIALIGLFPLLQKLIWIPKQQ
ncbi:Translocase of chloroplast 132, chloroplastic [Linum perenne]